MATSRRSWRDVLLLAGVQGLGHVLGWEAHELGMLQERVQLIGQKKHSYFSMVIDSVSMNTKDIKDQHKHFTCDV